MHSYRRFGTLAILGIVLLRVTVGYHFYMEGVTKVREGNFTSTGFLSGAVGPLAPFFHSLLPDYDGRIRSDRDLLVAKIKDYGNVANQKYGFDEQQRQQSAKVVANAIKSLDSLWVSYGKEIREYQSGFDRIKEMQEDAARQKVNSLAAQRTSIEGEWKSSIKPVLSGVDLTLELLQANMAKVATAEQRQGVGVIPFNLVPPRAMDTHVVDKIIPIFDMSVGILLMLGLLTPVAGIAAGIFLTSVVLTQFPGAAGAQPTYYQAIEAMACFFLAFADAGRYAGLDFLPWSYWQRRRAERTANTGKPVPVAA